jgi:hypothetical protein
METALGRFSSSHYRGFRKGFLIAFNNTSNLAIDSDRTAVCGLIDGRKVKQARINVG